MGGKISGRIKKDLAKRIKGAKKIIFLLDYDGTLTPICKRPSLAKMQKSTKSLLSKIAKKSWSKIFIVSGRILKDVKSLIGLRLLYYVGNHGIELEGPGVYYMCGGAKTLKPLIQKCCRILERTLDLKGVFIENKLYTMSLHYRLLDPVKIPAMKKVFQDAIRDLRKTKKIRITEGKKVLEVRPRIKCDKGTIVRRILKREKTKNILPICIGDDITDEDAFKALGKKGISIFVSNKKRKTSAEYRLNSSREVIKFLRWVLLIRNTHHE
ncbi:MAG: trehalose-phosphatase [Candidatus Omnitrophica bacterium]|nr:trehalose-phosphatase [Candidatus Omnitrophota bacterium]